MSAFGKSGAFAAILLLIVAVAIEAIAQAFYFVAYDRIYSPAALTLHRDPGSDPTAPTTELAEIAQRRILHPYLGYAMDRPETMGAGGQVHPLQKRGEGRFVVAVTGGSVANQIRTVLGEALREGFQARGLALEPVVVSLPVDGFKQPQQLASVAYFLSLGAEYDAVLNIDGFNDIVLPIVDNYERGVYPFYPRSWDSFVARRPSQASVLGAGEIAVLRREQARRIEEANHSLRGHSAILGLFHARSLSRSTARIAEIQRRLLEEQTALSFEASGPYEQLDDVAQVYDAAAELWARSSVLMHQLLTASDTAYFHVLQPNQYVEGGRNLTAEEREIAFDLAHPYARIARRGYPYLFEAAGEIRAAKVRYLDGTGIFDAVDEMVYSDACCHYNRFGKQFAAREIARWMTQNLTNDAR